MRSHAIAAVLLIATAAPATAQLTPEQARAKTDKAPVTVVLPDGTWRGRLLDIDAESVTIQLPGGEPKTLPLAGVIRVEARKRDSPGDGALAGAVVMGLWCLLVCGQGLASADDLGAAVISNALVGAGIGAAIDAGHTGSVALYKRPSAAPEHTSAGLFFSVRF
jgi:hypothetical protein